jgi:hypothetical protein
VNNNYWTLEKVCGSDNVIRIKQQDSGEYLYASDAMMNPDRRFVYAWADTSTSPNSDPDYWNSTADWELTEEVGGFVVKNVEYQAWISRITFFGSTYIRSSLQEK